MVRQMLGTEKEQSFLFTSITGKQRETAVTSELQNLVTPGAASPLLNSAYPFSMFSFIRLENSFQLLMSMGFMYITFLLRLC